MQTNGRVIATHTLLPAGLYTSTARQGDLLAHLLLRWICGSVSATNVQHLSSCLHGFEMHAVQQSMACISTIHGNQIRHLGGVVSGF